MQTFLTPDPLTIEIRNASGEIRVDLTDVATTTVDVVTSTSHPLGFLDDVIRAAKAQFAGSRSGFDSASSGFAGDAAPEDPTDRVRIEHRPPTGRPSTSLIDPHVTEPPDIDPQDIDPQDIDTAETVAGFDTAGFDSSGGAAGGRAGSGTLIVDTDPARDGWRSSFTVHVTAPMASGIRIQSQSADITVAGRAERLEARTASGDVRVDEVTGRSVVQTASGAVWITDSAQCDVRTASGDIQVHGVSANAVVHSTSGDIKLTSTDGNINARSVSGDIQVADATSGNLELVTVSGDVEVGIHAGSLTAIDLNTISGNTDTDFEVSAEAPAGPATGESAAASGTVGVEERALDLRVKTVSGNIRLRRSVIV